METLTNVPDTVGREAATSSYRNSRQQLLHWILSREIDRRQDQRIRLIQCLVAGLVAECDSSPAASSESAIDLSIADVSDELHQ